MKRYAVPVMLAVLVLLGCLAWWATRPTIRAGREYLLRAADVAPANVLMGRLTVEDRSHPVADFRAGTRVRALEDSDSVNIELDLAIDVSVVDGPRAGELAKIKPSNLAPAP